MTRLIFYLILLGFTAWSLYRFLKRDGLLPGAKTVPKAKKPNPGDNWVQVYETASSDEARQIQARLQEEGMECIVYQQGKKDIHGNVLKGVGIAVPKSSVSLAQKIISRLPV